MLKIREILEQQGFEMHIANYNSIILKKVDVREINECETHTSYENVFSFSMVNFDDNYKAIEQACRQYVKENGFKLEWFTKQQIALLDRAKEIYKDYNYEVWFKSYLMMNQDKLIAWLYANDIEVVE